jgi:O-antigen ligase
MVMILIGCIAFEIIRSKNPLKLIRNICIPTLLVACLCIAFLKVDFLNQLFGINFTSMINGLFKTGGSVDSSTFARLNRISRGIDWFSGKPVLGYGVENYSVLSGIYKEGFDGIADNNYIEILVDLGIIGFIVYYSFLIGLFIKGIRKSKDNIIYVVSATLVITLLLSDFGACNYKSAVSMLIIAVADSINTKKLTKV